MPILHKVIEWFNIPAVQIVSLIILFGGIWIYGERKEKKEKRESTLKRIFKDDDFEDV